MDDAAYLPWVSSATVEERVVAYADKRAHQDVVALDERFGEWIERHGASPEMEVARERAKALEREVCEAAGVEPAEVQRNPWVEAAGGMTDAAMPLPYLGYFWGEDAYGVEHAAVLFADEHAAAAGGQRLDVWRTGVEGDGDEGDSVGGGSAKRRMRVFEQMEERLATRPCSAAARCVSSANRRPCCASPPRATG